MINFNIINKCHTLLVTYTMLVWICWFQSLLDAQPQPGRSYKIGSGRPSILPSVHTFSRDWLISFLWNLAWCYGPIYSFVWLSWIFLKKSPLGKNYQKWSKMTQKHCFWTFWENHVNHFHVCILGKNLVLKL